MKKNFLRTALFGVVTLVLASSCAQLPTRTASSSPAPAKKTAPERPTHPLDPLTAGEFATLKEILTSQGKFSEKTVYSWVQLHEPPKEEVLAFKPGDKFRREAYVALLTPENKTAYEVIVDLNARTILSRKDLGNLQPFITDADYGAAFAAIDGSAEIRAILERRGYPIGNKKISEAIYCDMYAPGHDLHVGAKGSDAEGGHLVKDGKTIRAVRVLFADRQGGTNDYGPYLEGLMALVDVYERKVIEIFDTPGAQAHVKVPHDIFAQEVLGPKLKSTPLQIAPSAPGDLAIDGNRVRWGQWDFRYGFNAREGLVLYQIAYDDAGKLRPICYRAAISEMFVPYSDPSPNWVWREFFDSGEYGLGYVSNPVTANKELPSNALTFDAVLPDLTLAPSTEFPSRVFIFERDGGALFAHTQSSDRSRIYSRAKELVMGFIATVGNYDYLYQWVFRQDGSFGFEAELEGLILNKTVADEACQVCAQEVAEGPGTYAREGDQKFGTLVSPQVLGVFHQHWINLRLDFDIDGPINAVKEINTKALPFDAEKNPRARAFSIDTTIFGREQDAQRNLNPATNRTWVIYNPAVKSPLGHPAGYEIHPSGNTLSSIPESRWGDETSFVQRHLWVTKYQPTELYAAGWYPNQAQADYQDHLFHYAKDNESIYKADDVIWYSLGFTHVTKPEDFPIMPGAKVRVNFAPEAFFLKSPALGHATIEFKKPPEPAKP